MYINRINFNNNFSNQQNFKSKGPKGFKPVVKKEVKPVLRRIDNSLYGKLDQESEFFMLEISSNMNKIKNFFAESKFSAARIEQIKASYPSIIPTKYSRALTFDLGEEDNFATLSISKSAKEKDRVRLIVSNENGESKHFLIQDLDKVVANLNSKNPLITPPKLRFMTTKQIKESEVEKYIEKAYIKTSDYLNYLQNYKFPKKQKAVITELTEEVNVPQQKVITVFEKLKEVFDNGPEMLSSNVDAKIAPKSGRLLSMSMKQDDGSTVTISKTVSSMYGKDLTYIQVKHVSDNLDREYLNIDLATGKFLKSNPITGKPTTIKSMVYFFNQTDMKKYGLNEKLYNWSKDFFKPVDDNGSPNVSYLKRKPMKPLIAIGAAGGVYEPLEKSKANNISKEMDSSQLENSAVVDTELNDVVQKEVVEKAKSDAKMMADIYFKTFAEQFQKNILEKLADFKVKVENIFNQE